MSLDDEPTIQSDAFLHEIEMIMKILQMPSRYEEPFACPAGIALWEEYRRRNPDGLKVPPIDLMDCTDLNSSHMLNTLILATIATRFESRMRLAQPSLTDRS
jgi:hypothetical protein